MFGFQVAWALAMRHAPWPRPCAMAKAIAKGMAMATAMATAIAMAIDLASKDGWSLKTKHYTQPPYTTQVVLHNPPYTRHLHKAILAYL